MTPGRRAAVSSKRVTRARFAFAGASKQPMSPVIPIGAVKSIVVQMEHPPSTHRPAMLPEPTGIVKRTTEKLLAQPVLDVSGSAGPGKALIGATKRALEQAQTFTNVKADTPSLKAAKMRPRNQKENQGNLSVQILPPTPSLTAAVRAKHLSRSKLAHVVTYDSESEDSSSQNEEESGVVADVTAGDLESAGISVPNTPSMSRTAMLAAFSDPSPTTPETTDKKRKRSNVDSPTPIFNLDLNKNGQKRHKSLGEGVKHVAVEDVGDWPVDSETWVAQSLARFARALFMR